MPTRVDLSWLPLGAGGRSVRLNGIVFEAIAARRAGRQACALYHSALEVSVDEARYVIEMAPAWARDAAKRDVVAEGAVGTRAAGRLRAFRYEIRRWRDGAIPDVAEAVDSPQTLSRDPIKARRLLDLVSTVPTATWGRDELTAGEMWNSNSVVAWLLVSSGIDPGRAHLPAGGRAPGWDAGVTVAHREHWAHQGSMTSTAQRASGHEAGPEGRPTHPPQSVG
jgi:hypothetical protein